MAACAESGYLHRVNSERCNQRVDHGGGFYGLLSAKVKVDDS
jgi:hypothetical protein